MLNPELRHSGKHAVLDHLYETLLHLRPDIAPRALHPHLEDDTVALEAQRVLFVRREGRLCMAFSFSARPEQVRLPVPPGRWERLISSAESEWQGPGTQLPAMIDSNGELSVELQPHSFVCYRSSPREPHHLPPSR